MSKRLELTGLRYSGTFEGSIIEGIDYGTHSEAADIEYSFPTERYQGTARIKRLSDGAETEPFGFSTEASAGSPSLTRQIRSLMPYDLREIKEDLLLGVLHTYVTRRTDKGNSVGTIVFGSISSEEAQETVRALTSQLALPLTKIVEIRVPV